MVNQKQQEIISLLADLEQLEIYEYLVDLAKTLPKFEKDLYQEKYKIDGCVSRAWLKISQNQGKLIFQADSDSLVIKGILTLLWQLYDHLEIKNAQNFELSLFETTDFTKILTANRRSGLSNILSELKKQISSL